MTENETVSSAKALYLQAAALAGKEVSEDSPERLADIVRTAFPRVEEPKRREAVANLLRLLAAIIESPMGSDDKYHETNVEQGRTKTCPVYPFD